MDGQGLPTWAVSALKWAGALLALLLLVNYAAPRAWEELRGAVAVDTGDDEDEGLPEADAASTEPSALEGGEIVATADLATRNGTITGRFEELIALGTDHAEQLLVGFERVPADTACLTEVTLQAWAAHSTPTELLVHPAALAEIEEFENGQALPPDAIIEGSTPASTEVGLMDEGGGWVRWEVMGPYTIAHRSAPSDALVVLSIAHPEDDEDPERTSVFATTDGPELTRARLQWEAVEECSDLGHGGDVREEDPALREEAGDAGGESPEGGGEAAEGGGEAAEETQE